MVHTRVLLPKGSGRRGWLWLVLFLVIGAANSDTALAESEPNPQSNNAASTTQLIAGAQRSDDSAFWNGLFSICLICVGVGQIFVYWKQKGVMQAALEVTDKAANAAKEAADAAKTSADATIVSLRPWLSCQVLFAGPLTFNRDGDAILRFQFNVRNVGKTPAMNVKVDFPQVALVAPGREHSLVSLQRQASFNRGLPARGGGMMIPGNVPITDAPGRVLFPGDDFDELRQFKISRGEIEKSIEGTTEKCFWPELFGLVTYTYHMADVRADTGFIYRVSKIGNKPFAIGEEVGVGEMELEPHELWGGFAS